MASYRLVFAHATFGDVGICVWDPTHLAITDKASWNKFHVGMKLVSSVCLGMGGR